MQSCTEIAVEKSARPTVCEVWEKDHLENGASLRSELFARSVYPRARAFAAIVRWVWPTYFRKDFELIQIVANLRTESAIRKAAAEFRYHNPEEGILRGYFRLRISHRRLVYNCNQILKTAKRT